MEQEQQEPQWHPNLSVKQGWTFNVGCDGGEKHPEHVPIVLCSGARMTGKTHGVEHHIARHLWETPGARVALLAKTMRVMTNGGIWNDFMDNVIPEWIGSGIGFEFTTKDRHGVPGPTTDGKTRTVYFRVRNMYGGESELRLISLEHDHEVKDKLKSTKYSAIWVSELALFKDPKVFQNCFQTLRMFHLRPWQHLFIADTNPAEEGEDHWAYKLWYLRKATTPEEEKATRSMYLMEFFLEDNPFISKDQIAQMRYQYRDDPGEAAREMDGKWVRGHGTRGKHFADLFVPSFHVVGESDDHQIDISPDTSILYTGWDLGSVNHAACILEKRIMILNQIEYTVWNALDCLLYTGERRTIADFTLEFLELMDAVEAHCGKKFQWVHWSDDSALNVWRPTGASFDYLEVQIASKNRITLQGVNKPEHSVQTRVRIIRRLLKENRLFISARCQAIIGMMDGCVDGRSARNSSSKDFVAQNDYKHIFDALSYPIFMEAGYELAEQANRPSASTAVNQVKFVTLPL